MNSSLHSYRIWLLNLKNYGCRYWTDYYKEVSMKEIQFSIKINASKERVLATLWEDVTFRDWANMID